MEKRGSASQVSQNEKRFFDGLNFMVREEDVVKPEEEPVHQRTRDPDHVEQHQKDETFFDEAGGSVFGVKERAVKGAPEQAEVVVH